MVQIGLWQLEEGGGTIARAPYTSPRLTEQLMNCHTLPPGSAGELWGRADFIMMPFNNTDLESSEYVEYLSGENVFLNDYSLSVNYWALPTLNTRFPRFPFKIAEIVYKQVRAGWVFYGVHIQSTISAADGQGLSKPSLLCNNNPAVPANQIRCQAISIDIIRPLPHHCLAGGKIKTDKNSFSLVLPLTIVNAPRNVNQYAHL